MRESVILAALITAPHLVGDFEAGLETLRCVDPDHAALRDILLSVTAATQQELRSEISARLGPAPLEKLFSLRHVAITPCIRKPGDDDLVQMTIAEELAKLKAFRGLETEVAEAVEDLSDVADEAITWRLGQAAEARNNALRSQQQDRSEYDVGENGARINRDERSAFDALLEKITYSKPGR